MVKIKYVGTHQPQEVIDVKEEKAKLLVESNDYVYLEGDAEKHLEADDTEPEQTEDSEEENQEED